MDLTRPMLAVLWAHERRVVWVWDPEDHPPPGTAWALERRGLLRIWQVSPMLPEVWADTRTRSRLTRDAWDELGLPYAVGDDGTAD